MTTSYGLGPYWVGDLESLSPSAPPFTVDKSLQKQNLTNTSVNYPQVPQYGPYFDPASHLWNHSSAVGSKFEVTESMEISSDHSSFPAIYGYSSSQPSHSVASDYHVNRFLDDPFTNTISATSNEGVKPYYSPHISPLSQKDCYLSLGVTSGHGFDLLSNSSSAHLSGCGPSAFEQPQRRSRDGNHKLNWGSFWSGVNEQGKWSEYGQGFGFKDSKPDLLSSKSAFLFDGISESRPSIDDHARPFDDGSLNTINVNHPEGNTSNLKQDGCFNIFGGSYNPGSLGIDPQDSRSLSGCSRISTSRPASIPKESLHFQDPAVESVTNFNGSQNANGVSPGDQFSQSDFYMFGCTSTTSTFPVTKNNKSQYGESSSSKDGTHLAQKLNSKASVVANESNISAGYDYSYPIEPRIFLGLKCQSSNIIRRPPSSVTPSSSQIGQFLVNSIDIKDGSDRSQISPEMNCHFSSNCFDVEVNDAQAPYHVEKLSEGSDVHNPAEDSPCWRGASSDRFSPSSVPEEMAPDGFIKKLDEHKSRSIEDLQMTVDTSGRDFFSGNVKERNPSERPFFQESISNDNVEGCSVIRQPHCFDLNTGDGLQIADDSFVSTKECCILNKRKADSQPGTNLAAIQISEGVTIISPRQMSEEASFGGSGNFPPVVASNSVDVPSNSKNNHASSPPGDNASLLHCQMSSKLSDSNVDVDMLLETMMNLSEIFRTHCFSKRAAIPQQHSIAIKHVIANLNASMLMMAGKTLSTMPSFEVNDAAIAAVKLGVTADRLLDSVSSKYDPNTIGAVNKTEAIKKILYENFLEEEEMGEQQLLYKSLWLDAEASLCTMTAKARFLRVKAEMERTTPYDGSKDKEISSSTKATNAFGAVHETVDLATSCKKISMPSDCQKSCATRQNFQDEVPEVNKCHIPNTQGVTTKPVEFKESKATEEEIRFLSMDAFRQGKAANVSDCSGSTSHVHDVEASVMARYQIVNSRIENSEAISRECQDIKLLTNSVGAPKVEEASVLARFRILQSRINLSCSVDKDQVVEHGTDELGLLEKQSNALKSAFGPYPELPEECEDDDVNQFGSWYGNDCSSSDWEHISKKDLWRPNWRLHL